jgi:DNA-directed RNA polymerase omega subunit
MKAISLSRGPEIDTNKCVANIGSRYDMVIIASARAREIRLLNRNSTKREHIFTEVTALLEIQNGAIGPNYLRDKLAAQAKKQLAASPK